MVLCGSWTLLTGSAGSETSVQPDPPGNIPSVSKGSTDLFIWDMDESAPVRENGPPLKLIHCCGQHSLWDGCHLERRMYVAAVTIQMWYAHVFLDYACFVSVLLTRFVLVIQTCMHVIKYIYEHQYWLILYHSAIVVTSCSSVSRSPFLDQ